MAQDGLASFEPAFIDELATILRFAFEYMQRSGNGEPDQTTWLRDAVGGAVHLRLSTRSIEQPRRSQADANERSRLFLILLGDAEGLSAFRQAESAYREEMRARTPDAGPVEWAKAEAGLAKALRGIGLATGDEATLHEANRRTKAARAAIQPYDTSYNDVLDAYRRDRRRARRAEFFSELSLATRQ